MKIDNSWFVLESALAKLYRELNKEQFLKEDLIYLHQAYIEVDSIWGQILNSISTLKFGLLAEAPLYGEAKSYFYNPAVGATSFLNYKNAEDIVGPISSTSTKKAGIRPRKVEMIEKLGQAGFIILDLFPYCFDHKLTHVTYREIEKAKLYHSLFTDIASVYFVPKVKKLISVNPQIRFGFRYANIAKIIGEDVNKLITPLLGYESQSTESFHNGRNLNSKAINQIILDLAND